VSGGGRQWPGPPSGAEDDLVLHSAQSNRDSSAATGCLQGRFGHGVNLRVPRSEGVHGARV
jgi:hypothetical protein